jgi:hypothetical protein
LFGISMVAAGAPVAADAPPASATDSPAARNTGEALLLRFGVKDGFA